MTNFSLEVLNPLVLLCGCLLDCYQSYSHGKVDHIQIAMPPQPHPPPPPHHERDFFVRPFSNLASYISPMLLEFPYGGWGGGGGG